MNNDSSNKKLNSESHQLHRKSNSGYARIWRWHFYAGLFVAPFLTILAVTGLAMMLFANISGRDGERLYVDKQAMTQPLSVQAQAAVDAIKGGVIKQYIAPRAEDMVAVFRVDDSSQANMVAIDPYTANVVKIYPRRADWYHQMDAFHGDLFLGKMGDYLIETAASLTILMIITGWYLWWCRQKSIRQLFFTRFGKNNQWWRNTHGVSGTWVSIFLVFFLISGLAWAGIWGGKMVQAWSQFPAGKWGNKPVPVSTLTHGEILNDGKTKEVPWVLELTPMPMSTIDANQSINSNTIDSLDAFARKQGFEERYQLHFPKGETGVWTISQDSMSYDSKNPIADRTMHIDQYSGKILADIRYDDYNAFGKFMAVGIALHMGTLGWWSILANVVFCLAVIFMCVGGLVMWWKRRPSHAVGLTPPPAKLSTVNLWGLGGLLIVLAVMFPTAIIAIVSIFLIDWLMISRMPALVRYVK